jgi:hypothetical protein
MKQQRKGANCFETSCHCPRIVIMWVGVNMSDMYRDDCGRESEILSGTEAFLFQYVAGLDQVGRLKLLCLKTWAFAEEDLG